MSDDIFSEENEVKNTSQWVKWGKVGDRIAGTYIDRIDYEQDGKPKIDYVILVQSGWYHDKTGSKIELEENDEVKIGDKRGFEKFKKNQVKIGQLVGFEFKEEIKSKKAGYNDFKRVAVYLPKEEVDEVGEDGQTHKVFKPKFNTEWLAANDLTLDDVR